MSDYLFRSLVSLFFILLIIMIPKLTIAQSDYQIAQTFKKELENLQKSIEDAYSLEQLDEYAIEIDIFKKKYQIHKNLLNDALYPKNFDESLSELDNLFIKSKDNLESITVLRDEVKKGEEHIKSLTSEISQLSDLVGVLYKEKKFLVERIKILKSSPDKSNKVIDSLKNLSTDLRENMLLRDSLIIKIADEIFLKSELKNYSSGDIESVNIIKKVKSSNLLDNIQSLTTDNILYLNSEVIPDSQYDELLTEYKIFKSRWINYGSFLTRIYNKNSDNDLRINDINSLIDEWGNKLNKEFWGEIYSSIKSVELKIDSFNTPKEFYENLDSFIDKQIENVDNLSDFERDEVFTNFYTGFWKSKFELIWSPTLINNSFLSKNQLTDLNEKVLVWKLSVEKPFSAWFYTIIAIIFVVFTILFIRYTSRREKNKVLE